MLKTEVLIHFNDEYISFILVRKAINRNKLYEITNIVNQIKIVTILKQYFGVIY